MERERSYPCCCSKCIEASKSVSTVNWVSERTLRRHFQADSFCVYLDGCSYSIQQISSDGSRFGLARKISVADYRERRDYPSESPLPVRTAVEIEVNESLFTICFNNHVNPHHTRLDLLSAISATASEEASITCSRRTVDKFNAAIKPLLFPVEWVDCCPALCQMYSGDEESEAANRCTLCETPRFGLDGRAMQRIAFMKYSDLLKSWFSSPIIAKLFSERFEEFMLPPPDVVRDVTDTECFRLRFQAARQDGILLLPVRISSDGFQPFKDQYSSTDQSLTLVLMTSLALPTVLRKQYGLMSLVSLIPAKRQHGFSSAQKTISDAGFTHTYHMVLGRVADDLLFLESHPIPFAADGTTGGAIRVKFDIYLTADYVALAKLTGVGSSVGCRACSLCLIGGTPLPNSGCMAYFGTAELRNHETTTATRRRLSECRRKVQRAAIIRDTGVNVDDIPWDNQLGPDRSLLASAFVDPMHCVKNAALCILGHMRDSTKNVCGKTGTKEKILRDNVALDILSAEEADERNGHLMAGISLAARQQLDEVFSNIQVPSDIDMPDVKVFSAPVALGNFHKVVTLATSNVVPFLFDFVALRQGVQLNLLPRTILAIISVFHTCRNVFLPGNKRERLEQIGLVTERAVALWRSSIDATFSKINTHLLVHAAHQIARTGSNYAVSQFVIERVISFVRRSIRNRATPVPDIVAYFQRESFICTRCGFCYFNTHAHLRSLLRWRHEPRYKYSKKQRYSSAVLQEERKSLARAIGKRLRPTHHVRRVDRLRVLRSHRYIVFSCFSRPKCKRNSVVLRSSNNSQILVIHSIYVIGTSSAFVKAKVFPATEFGVFSCGLSLYAPFGENYSIEYVNVTQLSAPCLYLIRDGFMFVVGRPDTFKIAECQVSESELRDLLNQLT